MGYNQNLDAISKIIQDLLARLPSHLLTQATPIISLAPLWIFSAKQSS